MVDSILFFLGLTIGFITHEAGHQAAAWTSGDQISWHHASWTCERGCDAKRVAAGGFVLPAVASEAMLLKRERGSFERGWLAFNILQPLVLTVRHEAFRSEGDLSNWSRGDARIVEGIVLGHAATVALRWAWKDKPEWFEVLRHEDGLKLALVARW